MTTFLLLFKASLLLFGALTAAWLLRASSASARHALWSAAFVSLLALPFLPSAIPALRVPVPVAWMTEAPAPLAAVPPDARTTPSPSGVAHSGGIATRELPGTMGRRSASAPFVRMSVASAAFLVWLAGAALAAGALLVSLMRVHRLARAAETLADASWQEAAAAFATRLGLRRAPRVLVASAVRTPMAGGIWSPTVFLPPDAGSWTADRRDVVLAHELSHLARRDPVRHVAARLALACYWFHPLAWLAARLSTLAREQACDEAVLALGVRPSEYARVLLELADACSPSRASAALPMIERSLLEARLMAILDDTVRPRGRRPALVAAAALLLALTVGAAQPAIHATTTLAADVSPAVSVSPPIAEPRLVRFTGGVVAASPRLAGQGGAPACWTDDFRGSFRGSSVTIADDAGRSVVYDMIGTRNGDRIVQTHVGDQRLCMVAEGAVGLERARPSEWSAPRMIIESRRAGSTQQMEIRGPQVTWRVDGAERPVDAAAREWRAAMLAVLDEVWGISTLRGEESSLRGEISSLRGQESSLRGEISSLRGDVSSMRGEQSSIRGRESSLRGEISSIEGQVSSLRGQISSERGSISSLEASRYDLGDADRARVAAQLKAHDEAIARIERQLRDFDEAAKIAAVDKQIRDLDASGKVAAIDDQIRAFDESGKAAAIEKQIAALDVAGRTAGIEKRIEALDVDRRTRQMQDRLDDATKRLQRAVAAIK
jgi:beta-lactamase regulating signal transducer with metallopeptidase domain/predicted  nucleic acid-binding Zn-ribbon protein